MNKLFKLAIIWIFFTCGLAQAKISQSIDRTDISAGETFVLTIQVDDDQGDAPDLSFIPSDITIISNSQYQNTQIINGRRSSVKGWKLKLKTLVPGTIVIPSIPVGSESTKPITLNIKESSFKVDIDGQKDAIFLKAEVDQASPYVQQQVIYTVSLYRAISTHYENLSVPEVANSIVEKLGDDVSFEKMIGNQRYNVYQRKYVIFPQQSGELTVGPVTFTADVNDNSRQRRGVFLNSTRPISVSTQPVKLQVKPMQPGYQSLWLPAEHVELSASWSASDPQTNATLSEPSELKVGEPATWTLTLNVQGLSESQLPELEIAKVDGLQIYPDTPQKERQVSTQGVISQRIEKFAVIPSKPGKLTIPAVEVKWWDIVNDQAKTARLPSRTFNVLPSTTQPKQLLNLPTLPQSVEETTPVDNSEIRKWQLISAALLILWLLTLVALLRQKRTVNHLRRDPLSDPSDKKAQQQQALQTAKAAIKNQNANQLGQAIIELVNDYTDKPYYSLGSISKQIVDPLLAEKLNRLEKSRYAATAKNSTSDLINIDDLNKIISQFNISPKNAGYSEIPPLYPR